MFRVIRLLCALISGMIFCGMQALGSEEIPILLYHHINDVPANASRPMHRWSLSPEKFEAQMDWVFRHRFHPITMQQLIGHLKHAQALPPKPIVLSFDDGLKDHYSVVFPILKKRGFVATFFIITDSVGHSAFMDWEKILEMSGAGMDIEAHTVTHPNLADVSHEQARFEIFQSKSVLEKHLNKTVIVLAYPYGKYTQDVIAITKSAGYEGAVTLSGLNGGYLFRADQSYTLQRFAIEGQDNLDCVAHIKGFD
ncbi:MAG: polysaccharide deacetylase family protein [Candidatus Omnitrophica bacterium]|nr:polysaccharide deacetylase family protein [Candidatus Omnitrophota bacterium]